MLFVRSPAIALLSLSSRSENNAMRVTGLRIENFRNYPGIELSFGPGVNVLSGNNGQGKTNILEAIYLCSCARSHRTARDSELIRQGENYYQVELTYDDNGYKDQSIRLDYLAAVPGLDSRKTSMRQFWHNGIRQERIADLYGLFNAVIFAPEDLMLIKEGPQARRRFMDLLLSQVKPAYFAALSLYNRILSQRNRLLKTLRDQHTDVNNPDFIMTKTQLEVWDEQLVSAAAQIIHSRFTLTAQIHEFGASYQATISSGKEKLRIHYRTLSALKAEMSVGQIESILLKRLSQGVKEDILRGNTTIGPHRDDLDFFINDQILKIYGSQGQQRTAVLALKLAELNYVKELTKQTPVLLLDDVMSELDKKRRASLVDALKDNQVFITCTDTKSILKELSVLGKSEDINYFDVKSGEITAVKADKNDSETKN